MPCITECVLLYTDLTLGGKEMVGEGAMLLDPAIKNLDNHVTFILVGFGSQSWCMPAK